MYVVCKRCEKTVKVNSGPGHPVVVYKDCDICKHSVFKPERVSRMDNRELLKVLGLSMFNPAQLLRGEEIAAYGDQHEGAGSLA